MTRLFSISFYPSGSLIPFSFPCFLIISPLLVSRVTVLKEIRPKKNAIENEVNPKGRQLRPNFKQTKTNALARTRRLRRMWSGRLLRELPKVTRNSLIGEKIFKG